jgi:hypothetical protein
VVLAGLLGVGGWFGFKSGYERSPGVGDARGMVVGGCLLSVAWWLGCCWQDWLVLVVGSDLRAAKKRVTVVGQGGTWWLEVAYHRTADDLADKTGKQVPVPSLTLAVLLTLALVG